MFGYEDIALNITYHPIYFFLALALLTVYTIFTYKYTVPAISTIKKIILVTIRSFALLLLILIFFEPILSLSTKIELKPINMVFIDHSRSMKIEYNTNRDETVNEIVNEISSNSNRNNIEFYLFGNNPRRIDTDSLMNLSFYDGVTNISEIFSAPELNELQVASITLITDGVYTDLIVKKVLFNEVMYAETPTTIISTIQNRGYAGEQSIISLYDNGVLIDQKNIVLSESGIQKVKLDYTPETGGEKKLLITASSLKDEFTTANNKTVFYVKVLTNKINILLLASSPSSDLSFIRNTLLADENLTVNTLIQISKNEFLDPKDFNLIDSANVFFLIGFPSLHSPDELVKLVSEKIVNKKVPYLITLSSETSVEKLNRIESELPFTTPEFYMGYREVQAEISRDQLNNPVLKHPHSDPVSSWNKLPPVLQPSGIFNAKPESKILANIKVDNKVINSPLILTRNLGRRRSIAILAKEIWRWKLQTATKNLDLFDNFILNCVKWLHSTDEQKQVSIRTSKKSYSQGEQIEFAARVLDESLNPVSDAEVNVKINSDKNSYEIEFQNVGKGLYEGFLRSNETGDFSFKGEAIQSKVFVGSDEGNFNIGELEIELVDPVMNYNLLNLIAKETGGKYYSSDDYSNLIDDLSNKIQTAKSEKVITSEVSLWSDEWLLVIVILLFSLEWFLRKQSGML
jgi:hypothetical protein